MTALAGMLLGARLGEHAQAGWLFDIRLPFRIGPNRVQH